MLKVNNIFACSSDNKVEENSIDFVNKNQGDLELIRIAKSGDLEARNILLERYEMYLSVITYNYFIVGADKDDVMQTARISFNSAIDSFNMDKVCGDKKSKHVFRNFATVCVKYGVCTEITAANRRKHEPLNTAESMDKPIFSKKGERDIKCRDIYEIDIHSNPEEECIVRELESGIKVYAKNNLSRLEWKVFLFKYQGFKDWEIADKLNVTLKAIDNAYQRAKKKIKLFIDGFNR